MRWTRTLAAALFLCAAAPAMAKIEPAYIVVDAEAGRVLLHSQADQPWYPASLTKMMTAYVTFQALKAGTLKLTSPVKISAHAAAEPRSKMGYPVGTIINVDNALKMMLVQSANDIAVAIAETVGGSERKFVAMMNVEATRLGMGSTHFNNPNGWHDSGQFSTARDLAVLTRAIYTEFPEYRNLFGIPAIKVGKRILRSQNRLLEQFRGTTGMKTGYTCPSGLNIVATAQRNGRHLIVVVLGATSSVQRAEAAARLLTQGFGSWFGSTKPKIDEFGTGRATAAPVNMRQQVCGKRIPSEDDDVDPLLAKLGGVSALVPRFVLMAPVPVYTGRADAAAGVAADASVSSGKTIKAGSVPMPHLRPRAPGGTSPNAFVPLPEDPTAIQANKPN